MHRHGPRRGFHGKGKGKGKGGGALGVGIVAGAAMYSVARRGHRRRGIDHIYIFNVLR